MDNLAVIIPAYNEEQTIAKVIQDVQKATTSIQGTAIYVYDNNSTDNTARIAKKSGAVVRKEYVRGKGAVIRRAFRDLEANVYVMLDGDDTYPAEAIPEMYDQVVNRKVDMVVGDRLSSTYFEENKRPFHNFGNQIVRFLINKLFKTDIRDILTGYRAFGYCFIKTFPVLSRGFEIETEMSIHAAQKRMFVENQIIDYRDRPHGSESKLNTASDGLNVIFTIVKLFRFYRPLLFFGLIAGLIALVSSVAFIFHVFIPYWHTRIVENIPTLIVATFGWITAIIAFFSGLILDSSVVREKCDFELELIEAEDRLIDLRKYD